MINMVIQYRKKEVRKVDKKYEINIITEGGETLGPIEVDTSDLDYHWKKISDWVSKEIYDLIVNYPEDN